MTDADRKRTHVRPYGDRRDDGAVQLSFVLPVAPSDRAREAAQQYVKKLGFSQVMVAHMEAAGEGFSYFVCYGRSQMYVDWDQVHSPEVARRKHGFDELNEMIQRDLGRPIVVVGACIGTDAHAVGIDAIMNMKGFAGDYGLERYPMFRAYNLGAQVEPVQLLDRAQAVQADAVLVSQVVTQREIHKENARAVVELARERGLYGHLVLVWGGPRVDNAQAAEVGFDAGFGPGTKPSDVANYLYYRLLEKRGLAPA